MIKRLFDLVSACLGLIIFSPIFLILAVAIKLESRGPLFYRGARVGLNGRPFRIFKFRTMVAQAEQQGPASTHEQDRRITRCGRLLRRFKLDELAQLLNVVKGEMSLVGPRPEVQKFVDRYTEEEKTILTVRPGLTDWSSIKFHNEGEIIAASGIADADEAYARLIRPEKLRLQLKYVREHNILLDIRIIFCTILSIFSTRLGGRPVGLSETLTE